MDGGSVKASVKVSGNSETISYSCGEDIVKLSSFDLLALREVVSMLIDIDVDLMNPLDSEGEVMRKLKAIEDYGFIFESGFDVICECIDSLNESVFVSLGVDNDFGYDNSDYGMVGVDYLIALKSAFGDVHYCENKLVHAFHKIKSSF